MFPTVYLKQSNGAVPSEKFFAPEPAAPFPAIADLTVSEFCFTENKKLQRQPFNKAFFG